MRQKNTPTAKALGNGGVLLLEEHGGNTPNQNTEDPLKPNRSDYIAPLLWFIYKYKVKPNTEENGSFTLKE